MRGILFSTAPRDHAGRIYANRIPFSIYNFSNFNVLMIAIGVFEGAESNEINFI